MIISNSYMFFKGIIEYLNCTAEVMYTFEKIKKYSNRNLTEMTFKKLMSNAYQVFAEILIEIFIRGYCRSLVKNDILHIQHH